MSDKPISDLRRRMIADMTIRTFSDKTQRDYIRNVEAFAKFLGRSPDTATGDDIRRFQRAQVEQGGQPTEDEWAGLGYGAGLRGCEGRRTGRGGCNSSPPMRTWLTPKRSRRSSPRPEASAGSSTPSARSRVPGPYSPICRGTRTASPSPTVA